MRPGEESMIIFLSEYDVFGKGPGHNIKTMPCMLSNQIYIYVQPFSSLMCP